MSFQSVRLYFLCVVFACALGLPQWISATDTGTKVSVLQRYQTRIAFLDRRLASDPEDYVSEVARVSLTIASARITGDLSHIESAYRRLTSILTLVPQYTAARISLIAVALTSHDFTGVISLAEAGLKESPQDRTIWEGYRSDALYEIGDISQACELATNILNQDEKSAQSYFRVARCAEHRGNFKEAGECLSNAAAVVDGNPAADEIERAWIHSVLGRFYFRRGRFEDAAGQYSVSLGSLSDWWTVLLYQGELLGAQRNFPDAIRNLTRAYDESSRPEVAHALGDLYSLAKDETAARKWHTVARDRYRGARDNHAAYFIHHEAGLLTDSLAEAELAVQLARKDLEQRRSGDAYDALAWALFKKGELAEAEVTADTALKSAPFSPHILYHGAMIKGAIGKLKESRELLSRAHGVSPHLLEFHVHG